MPDEFSPTPFYRAAAVLVALGLLWALVSAVPSRTQDRAETLEETILHLSGRVIPDEPGYAGVRVRFSFPEVPLDVEQDDEELGLVPDGVFTTELALTSPVRPTWCSVTAWKEGGGRATRERVELTASGTDVGTLRLATEPPPQPSPPPRAQTVLPDSAQHNPPFVPYSNIATP